MAYVLSQSPTCICLHEPEPVLIKEATLYHYGLLSDEQMRAVLLSTRSPTLHGKVYGESNQKLSTLIPVLADAFPEAQFIWLVRDGRDVVASTYYARQWYVPVGELLGQRRYLAGSLKLQEWIWYRLRGDLTGEMSTAEWEALSRFEKNCWLWSRTNENIQERLTRLPASRWMLLRLVNLFERLPEICQFVGVEVPPDIEEARYNASVGKRGSGLKPKHWTEWSGGEKEAFEKWCGDMMDELYPDWRDQRGQWQRTCKAASLPPAKASGWQQRARLKLASLARRVRGNPT